MANILIIRFSAIGDVAMTVPVVDSLARQYPANNYTVVSQSFLYPLFAHCPDNVRFAGVDLRTGYRGAPGMYRLYRELLKQKFDAVADLHDVLRTKMLRILFRWSGLKVKHINKGRKEKRQLTGKGHKIFRQLKPVTERYADVFRALGQPLAPLDFRSVFGASRGNFSNIEPLTGEKSGVWAGIAPFAKHRGKIYPLDCTEQVVAHFAGRPDVKVFLFGGGTSEKEILEAWCAKYPQTVSVVGKLNMPDELILISYLDVMLSMDSANMHLASLTATPVVSVWGATHPYAGFYGYNQSPANTVQADLFCRPCSIYGNKPCYRKNTECLAKITPQTVIDKMEEVIRN
jgi:ADP-heptose:LPS heptosyltransferase